MDVDLGRLLPTYLVLAGPHGTLYPALALLCEGRCWGIAAGPADRYEGDWGLVPVFHEEKELGKEQAKEQLLVYGNWSGTRGMTEIEASQQRHAINRGAADTSPGVGGSGWSWGEPVALEGWCSCGGGSRKGYRITIIGGFHDFCRQSPGWPNVAWAVASFQVGLSFKIFLWFHD